VSDPTPWKISYEGASMTCGKIGDVALLEPALDAFALKTGRQVLLPVFPHHHGLYGNHPRIEAISSLHENPDHMLLCSDAAATAINEHQPFAAGYFRQLGLNPREHRVHYRNHGTRVDKRFRGHVLIAPFAYNDHSRPDQCGSQRPDKQPPLDFWKGLLARLRGPVTFLCGRDEITDPPIPGANQVRGLDLSDTMAAYRAASCLIATNTGLLHIASGAGIPTVFLCASEPAQTFAPDCPCDVVSAPYADAFDIDEVMCAVACLDHSRAKERSHVNMRR
jgi:hypothetical protein